MGYLQKTQHNEKDYCCCRTERGSWENHHCGEPCSKSSRCREKNTTN